MKARGEQLSGQPSLAYDELRLGRATRHIPSAEQLDAERVSVVRLRPTGLRRDRLRVVGTSLRVRASSEGGPPTLASRASARQPSPVGLLVENVSAREASRPSRSWLALQASEGWLGGRDSNPDTVVQSHVSYRWTTSQYRRGAGDRCETLSIFNTKGTHQARCVSTGTPSTADVTAALTTRDRLDQSCRPQGTPYPSARSR